MRSRIAIALCVAALGATAVVAAAVAGPGELSQQLSAKRWRALEPSPLDRTEVAAARIGRHIYVVGGFLEASGETTNKVARYDVRRDRWRVVAPLPLAVNHPTAAATGGRLYVHGGFSSAGGLSDATARLFEYRPGRDRWIELPSSNEPRAAHALGAIGGKLYAAGGANSTSEQLSSLEVYDIASRSWSPGASMSVGRNHVGAAVLDGRLYVLGGRPPFNLSVAERYDPATNSWTTLAPLTTARSGFAAVAVAGSIVAFGGEESATIAPVEAYDPATDSWSSLPAMRTPRHGLGGASKGKRVFALEGGPQPGLFFSRVVEFLDVR